MLKPVAKNALKRAKRSAQRKWSIVSYSIDSDVLEAFKRACKRHHVKGSTAIEAIMLEFNKLK